MSLTITLPPPGSFDPDRLRREVVVALPELLGGGITYTVEGEAITIEELTEEHRAAVQVVFDAHAAKRAERDAVAAAHAANVQFLGLASPTQAQAVAQVKALTRQMNFLARTLFDNGTL